MRSGDQPRSLHSCPDEGRLKVMRKTRGFPGFASRSDGGPGLGKRGKPGKRAASVRKNPVETVMTVTMELTVPRNVPAQSSQDSRP
jgi:hypothetical protein